MLDLLGPLAKVVPPPPGRATVPPPAGDHEDRVVQGGRLLVLATKNSDSETTVKAMDVAATLKAMAKSNDPKVREAAALMEAEASSRSKSLSAPPSPIHRPKLPTPPRPPFLPAARDFRSPGREFDPESARLIDWETSNDIQKAPC